MFEKMSAEGGSAFGGKTKNGSALVFSLMVLAAMLVVAIGTFSVSMVNQRTSTDTEKSISAFQAADSGIEIVAQEINKRIKASSSADLIDTIPSELICPGSGSTGVAEYVDLNFLNGKKIRVQLIGENRETLTCADSLDKVMYLKSVGEYGGTMRAVEVALGLDDPCGGQISITYGGQDYPVVAIGNQCWFAENLNVGTFINSSLSQDNDSAIEKWCYGNNDSNNGSGGCNTGTSVGKGGLYTWSEAMGLNSSCNTNVCTHLVSANHQGICPSGWHIPSIDEWNNLINYLKSSSYFWCNGNSDYIAKSMASRVDWDSRLPICAVGNSISSNNSSGFNAQAGGMYGSDVFFDNKAQVFFWSATQFDFEWSHYLYFAGFNSTVFTDRTFSNYGFSVRCIKN